MQRLRFRAFFSPSPSRPKISFFASKATFQTGSKGFTLIEVLISLVIIAFIVSIAIPRLGRSLGTQIRATTRKIATINKELHHYARLKNKTYRLVIDFGDKDKDRGQGFYVESASQTQLLADPEATPFRGGLGTKPPPNPFAADGEILRAEVPLPFGVKFEDVELESQKKPVTEGKAYIHFFPQGLVDRAIIHLTDGKQAHWSLIVNPLTGRTDIQQEYLKLQDVDK